MGHLGAISLKNLTKRKERKKGFLEKNECDAKACSSVSFELSALSIGVPESTD